jgi:rifamycin polyketide synthase module 1/2/3
VGRDGLIRALPELLREHAESAGQRVAYSDPSRSVSYAELEQRTRSLAGHLTRTGLRAGDRVAMALSRCWVWGCLTVCRGVVEPGSGCVLTARRAGRQRR